MKTRFWVFACSIAWAVNASALEVYQWVDEDGVTQVSDKVPDKYKDSAKVIQVLDYGPPKPRAPRSTGYPLAPKAPSARSEPAAQASKADEKPEEKDCDTLRREFQQSQECFAPYRVVGGGLKAEAFKHCKQLPNPSVKCGPPSD